MPYFEVLFSQILAKLNFLQKLGCHFLKNQKETNPSQNMLNWPTEAEQKMGRRQFNALKDKNFQKNI